MRDKEWETHMATLNADFGYEEIEELERERGCQGKEVKGGASYLTIVASSNRGKTNGRTTTKRKRVK